MLLQLNIKNFALIENLTISFDKGLHVFSGETGAGKSILIDAISYVLGSKFSKDFIRTGEDRTYVEAVFTVENEKTIEIFKQLDIEYEDLLIISRETFQSGKSIAKINGKTTLLSNIKLVSQTILDIHGQHENQNLLDPSNHMVYLDAFDETLLRDPLLNYNSNYKKLQEVQRKIEALEGKDGDNEKVIDFLKYQIDEINNANLKVGEDIELEQRHSILIHAEKIDKVLSKAYEVLYHGDEQTNSVYDHLGLVAKELRTVENHLETIKGVADAIENIYYSLEEEIEKLRHIKETIYYDQNELDTINQRIYQITSYKKKYGKSIEEILTYKEKIETQYSEYINRNEILDEMKEQKKRLTVILEKQSWDVHVLRGKIADELEKRIQNELSYIGLEKSVFKVDVSWNSDTYHASGSDKVQFNISTNPGEPVKPLDKVVSGGELSRIMLALKTVFVDKDEIPSIIFDEVDTGISGRIAHSVAEKMYVISSKHQVFCVTHLPQIACMSDTHYLISKQSDENKTFTTVRRLNDEEKRYEVARMIGGAEVTQLTLDHSKELIHIADEKKEKLI